MNSPKTIKPAVAVVENAQAKADAHCKSLTAAAITSSKNHESALKAALVADIIFGLEYGRYEHLSALFAGVSVGDQEAVRYYMVNLAREYGYTPDSTKPKAIRLPFVYRQSDKRFEASKADSDAIRTMISASKAAILEKGVAGLSLLGFGRANVKNDTAGTETDPLADLVKAIERAAARGAKISVLEQIAKPLDGLGYHADIIGKAEKAKVSPGKIEKLEKQLAAAKAKMAAMSN